MSGRGYVPLNPKYPVERIANIINRIDADVMAVCEECFWLLPSLLPLVNKAMHLIFLDFSPLKNTTGLARADASTYLSSIAADLPAAPQTVPGGSDVAYLLFTSGSTGEPKGVPISHANVRAYIDYTCARYGFNEHDRFSQTADMSFDLSILEIFPCWESGACLYCLPKSSVMLPAKFIRDHELTVWISVPSVGAFLDRMRLLHPGAFPSLRYCLFDGEPLLASIASKWQAAAPSAIVENLYGPTEATVAISDFRWKGEESLRRCKNGIVPIGWIFKGQFACVVDENLLPVFLGTLGELCLGGSQVCKGYYSDPDKTKQQFIKINNGGKIWYRTGDLVIENEDGCLNYIGRIDNQVKILGHRVELQEIDHALRRASSEELAVAIAWPLNSASAEGVVGFIPNSCERNEAEIIEECKKTLPAYMAPSRIVFIKNIPLNGNAKIDRLQLQNILKQEKEGVIHE